MMKLKPKGGDALCPICALNGEVNPLFMHVNSLNLGCIRNHAFDTLELSKMAVKHESQN